MAVRGVIFVGPSLRPPRPPITGADYRPPAARGDVLQAAREGARVIGLIDGVFHQELAVTPREIRDAAALGARLFGGASMGALRACDCPDVMTGIGEVFEKMHRGELSDDDEVAVTFHPGTYELMAYPLVQIREVVRIAAERDPRNAASLDRFLKEIRQLPFHDRTLEIMRTAAATAGVPWPALASLLADPATDVKGRDARAVAEAIGAALLGEPAQ